MTKGYLVLQRSFRDRGATQNLLRTVDGGLTWTPQSVVADQIGTRGVASGGLGIDYLLGGGSSLLATTSGGQAAKQSTIAIQTKQRAFKKLPPSTVTVTGVAKPANAGDTVTVSYLAPGTRISWRHQTVKADASGKFTSSWRLATGTNTFVAQWLGNFQSAGRGSVPLTITVKAKKK